MNNIIKRDVNHRHIEIKDAKKESSKSKLSVGRIIWRGFLIYMTFNLFYNLFNLHSEFKSISNSINKKHTLSPDTSKNSSLKIPAIDGLNGNKLELDINVPFDKYNELRVQQNLSIEQCFKDFRSIGVDLPDMHLMESYNVPDIHDTYLMTSYNDNLFADNDSVSLTIKKAKKVMNITSIDGNYYRFLTNYADYDGLHAFMQYILENCDNNIPPYNIDKSKYCFKKLEGIGQDMGFTKLGGLFFGEFDEYKAKASENTKIAIEFIRNVCNISVLHKNPATYLRAYLKLQNMDDKEIEKEVAKLISHCIYVYSDNFKSNIILYRINKELGICGDTVKKVLLQPQSQDLAMISDKIMTYIKPDQDISDLNDPKYKGTMTEAVAQYINDCRQISN